MKIKITLTSAIICLGLLSFTAPASASNGTRTHNTTGLHSISSNQVIHKQFAYRSKGYKGSKVYKGSKGRHYRYHYRGRYYRYHYRGKYYNYYHKGHYYRYRHYRNHRYHYSN